MSFARDAPTMFAPSGRHSSFGKADVKAEYCRDHAEGGMVNVVSKRCTHHGCAKRPSWGKAGSKAEYCRDHGGRR